MLGYTFLLRINILLLVAKAYNPASSPISVLMMPSSAGQLQLLLILHECPRGNMISSVFTISSLTCMLLLFL